MSALTVILPASAYAHLVWADPLFYLLTAMCMLFTLKFFQTTSAASAALAGLSLGLLFLAKQYGLFFNASAIVTTMIAIATVHHKRPAYVRGLALLILGMALTIGPLLIRNIIAHQANPLGYRSHFDTYLQTIMTLGWDGGAKALVNTGFYQISGLIFGTYGLLLYMLLGALFRSRGFSRGVNLISAFLAIATGGILIISTVHMLSYDLAHFPNGRYFASFTPFIIILGFRMLTWPGGREIAPSWVIVGGVLGLTGLLYAYTPLRALVALSLVNNAELSFLNWFINGVGWLWVMDASATEAQRVIVAALLFFLMLVFGLARRQVQPVALAVLMGLALFQNYHSHRLIGLLSSSQWSHNDIFRFVVGARDQGLITRFDNDLKGSNLSFHSRFWLGAPEPIFIDPAAAMPLTKIEFGRRSGSSATDTVVSLLGGGGGDAVEVETANINGLKAPGSDELGRCLTEDTMPFVATGSTTAHFSFPVIPGSYMITVQPGTTTECAQGPVKFQTFVDGAKFGGVAPWNINSGGLKAEVQAHSEMISIDLAPAFGAVWAAAAIEIRRLDPPAISAGESADLFVTRRKLPLEIATRSADLFVYRVEAGKTATRSEKPSSFHRSSGNP
ncbi:hypothetical protein N825_01180 [Skermanella stibiiresistens SB22]|uniref:Uncharacterized protein n=2 Tax=Skermanella TaxID=204447 RepID=W9H984_9PROT|nr:hypothetical protein N825_01180 [Skermanella stibiiresistens SB22]